nr:hypothetical protein GCM10025699_37360 [Microbacterium flavescens]
MRAAVSYVPRSVVTIGTFEPRPSSRRVTGSGSGNPPLSTIPEIEGNVPAAFASIVARSTSERSAAMTTTAPSSRRGSTLTIDMPATTTASASRVSRSGSPESSSPPTERMMPRMDGATRYRSSGMAHTGTVSVRGPRAVSTERVIAAIVAAASDGSERLATTANSSARSCASSVRARSAIWPISAAVRGSEDPSCSGRVWFCAERPPRTRSTGAPRFAAMRAL